jgi:hypothetical protein
MTHTPAQPAHRRTPLSTEEQARGQANMAPYVVQELLANGRWRVTADTPDTVELFQGAARLAGEILQQSVVSYANGRDIVITFGQNGPASSLTERGAPRE